MKKEDLKIVFFGTPEFAVASLDRIVKDGYNVVAAVTMPDKPAGRGHKMFQSPVKEYAIANGIPLMQPAKLKDEDFINELRGYNADLFIVYRIQNASGSSLARCPRWARSTSMRHFSPDIAEPPR